MTTLQTLSTRNIHSADPSDLGAQSVNIGAGDAPGFAGVLEAFTEPDDAIEPLDESVAEDAAEDAGSDEVVAESSDGAKSGDGEVGDEGSEGQIAEKHISQRVSSSGDLAMLLTNAASIDLAALASGQLKVQGTENQQAEPKSDQANPTGQKSSDSKSTQQTLGTVPDTPGVERADGRFQSDFAQRSMKNNESAGARAEGSAGAKVNAHDQAAQKQAEQAASDSKQVVQPDKAQIIQVSQSIVADMKGNSRRLEGLKPMSEIAEGASKARAVSGSESAGKAGGEQGGLDLGKRSQNANRLTDSKPTDDRALMRQQVMAQVQRGLASIMNTQGGTMKIRLSPEHLGEVKIQLSTKDGHVRVQIDAKNDEARGMLKDGLEGLRSAMESRGVTVDDLSIQGRQQSEFDRLFGGGGQGGARDQNPGDRPQSDDQRASQDNGGEDQVSETGEEASSESRGVWTELGLDAIA